ATSQAVPNAVGILQGHAAVAFAQPNFIYHAITVPNDPDFTNLWGMSKIQAPAAWDISTGSPSVVVASIDTGVDYTPPDLATNVWTNPGEIPGNGIDDDGDGYVDDVHGYDFYNNDSDPIDDNNHGTHTSGTIGAVGNNSTGVVGVNWGIKIIAV